MGSEANTITLKPREYGKLGISHCDVTREGFIAVVGEQRDITDGESIIFDKVGITASRKDNAYTFVKN
jgi:hypothetical protein